MDWPEMVGLALGGGLLVEVVRQAGAGWRQARRAKGRRGGLVDALRRSRLWWIERTYEARHLAAQQGAQLPEILEGQDPYVAWEIRSPEAGGDE